MNEPEIRPEDHSVVQIDTLTNQTKYEISYFGRENNQMGSLKPRYHVKVGMNIPWADDLKNFVDKAIIIEVLDHTRFYLWDSEWKLWYSQSSEFLDGPFVTRINPRMHGLKEYGTRSLVKGDYTKTVYQKNVILRESRRGGEKHFTLTVNSVKP